MRILVCGDRHWPSLAPIRRELAKFSPPVTVIEGEAPGADTFARLAARELGFPVQKFPAQWAKYGRAAGPIRNREMLRANPDLVLAFHPDLSKSRGTADMVAAARKAGVPVKVFRR